MAVYHQQTWRCNNSWYFWHRINRHSVSILDAMVYISDKYTQRYMLSHEQYNKLIHQHDKFNKMSKNYANNNKCEMVLMKHCMC